MLHSKDFIICGCSFDDRRSKLLLDRIIPCEENCRTWLSFRLIISHWKRKVMIYNIQINGVTITCNRPLDVINLVKSLNRTKLTRNIDKSADLLINKALTESPKNQVVNKRVIKYNNFCDKILEEFFASNQVNAMTINEIQKFIAAKTNSPMLLRHKIFSGMERLSKLGKVKCVNKGHSGSHTNVRRYSSVSNSK